MLRRSQASHRRRARAGTTRILRAALEALESRIQFAESIYAFPGADGHIIYKPQPLGDHIEDFGNVGYMGGAVAIPDVPVKATIGPVAGDDEANIEAAIASVAALPLDASGFRGAVLLLPGDYDVAGQINITVSGIVLRGVSRDSTIIRDTGTDQNALISIDGATSSSTSNTQNVVDKYVAVGAHSVTVASASGFAVGDIVIVHRPSPQSWINVIGMNLLDNPWMPGDRDVNMERTITHIDGNVLTLDAPLVNSLDQQYTDAAEGPITVYKYNVSNRVNNVGIEYLGGTSNYDPSIIINGDLADENHAWDFISIRDSSNTWVRGVRSEHFAYSCVHMLGGSKWGTISDSECLDPVSETTGGRKYSFANDDGTYHLFKNLYSREGRHDYVEGSGVVGPNVFVDDRADATHADAGPHHRWSTGVLWDNLKVGQLNIQDRGNSGTGHGHAGANQVVWNSTAGSFIVQSPKTAQNWLIGGIGTLSAGGGVGFHDPGLIDSSGPSGPNVTTRSLYHAQMAPRLKYENYTLREMRLGDADNYLNDGAIDNVAVDAAWKTAVQSATGLTGVGFDTVANGQLVPFTFNYAIDPGTYIVNASLSLGAKSAGNSSVGDAIFFENAGRIYTWAQLGLAAPTATADGYVIDLTPILAALQDGKLNVAISGNTAIDWATLDFATASTTQPLTSTINPVADAYVRDGTSASTNFGTATTLDTKLDTVNNARESFLKFDLSTFSGVITNAYVRLVPTTVNYSANTFDSRKAEIYNQISFVSNDAWTETGINWNNKPGSDPAFDEFVSFVNEPLRFDVTSLARGALAGDKFLSLRINSMTNDTNGQLSFASRENSNVQFRPQLVIQTYNALLPTADAYVRSGANANLNFGTATDLAVKLDTSQTTDNNREAYLKFDTSSLGSAPAGGTVRLMPTAITTSATGTGHFVATDSWTETGITWNTRPAASTLLGTWLPYQTTPAKFDVTSQLASTITGDDLLSVRVSSSVINAGVNQYASREYGDDWLRPLLILKNLAPQITNISDIISDINTATPATWFGIWDAETAAGALTLSATSSNTTLLPNANITFGGSGADRTFTLTPASGQTGATNVTITVTDAQGQSSSFVFQYSVIQAPATINGDFDSVNENDVIRIVRSGTFLDVIRNNVNVMHSTYSAMGPLAIRGLGGSDQLILDVSGGNPIPTGGLTLDGGLGTDSIFVVGGAGADAVGISAGNIVVSSLNAAITGAEQLTITLGTGADTLSASGNASVNTGSFLLKVTGGGSLALSGALPDYTDVDVTGATLDLNGASQTIDALTGSGTVLTNTTAATLTVGQQNSGMTFSGILDDGTAALSLTKNGTGKLVISGNNGYSGVTRINAGIIESGNSASLAGLAGAVQFNGGTFHVTANTISANVANKYTTTYTGATSASTGTFDVDPGVTLTVGVAGTTNAGMRTNGGGSHGGRFTKTGLGTLRVLTANGQQDDIFNLNQGTLSVEHGDAMGRADAGVRIDMKTGTTLVLKQDVDTNFLTPVNALDAGGAINITLDRLTAGASVSHSFNTLTSTGAFTLNLATGANISSGSPALSIGNVILSGAGTFNIANNLNVTGPVTGAFGLTKQGTGTMNLTGTNTYTGATSVTAGTLIVSPAAIPANNAVSVSGGVYRMSGAAAAFRLASLTVSSTAAARVDADGNSTLITDSLTLTSLGKLQLNDNDLVVNNGNFTTIRNQMIQAFNNGGLSGISTSTDGSQILALFDNALVGSGTWNGQPIGANAVVGKYTYFGDANMDGQVTGDDYTIIDSNLNTTPAPGLAWLSGDVNLDGIVTGDDYTTIDSNLNLGVGNPLTSSALLLTPASSPDAWLVNPSTAWRDPRDLE